MAPQVEEQQNILDTIVRGREEWFDEVESLHPGFKTLMGEFALGITAIAYQKGFVHGATYQLDKFQEIIS